jgi:transporter family protein
LLDSLHPNLLGFIAAFFVALARTCYRGALTSLSPMATVLVSLLVNAVFAWAYYQLEGGWDDWPIRGVLWFMAAGTVGTLGARYVSFVSILKVGLARGSIVVQTSLVWSAAMAYVFLGEQISFGVGLGTLAIMFGSVLLLYKQDMTRKHIPLRNYTYPFVTAICLALSHLFLKSGFFWIPSAPVGMGVATATALFLLLVIMPFTNERLPKVWERRPLLIVTLGGVFNALAAVFFQSAVKGGRIVEVIPINRLSVLLIIFFSWLFFQKQENITSRVVLGGLLSVVGAFAIVSGR